MFSSVTFFPALSMEVTPYGETLHHAHGLVVMVLSIELETAQILRPDKGVRIVLYKDHLWMLKHAMYIPVP